MPRRKSAMPHRRRYCAAAICPLPGRAGVKYNYISLSLPTHTSEPCAVSRSRVQAFCLASFLHHPHLRAVCVSRSQGVKGSELSPNVRAAFASCNNRCRPRNPSAQRSRTPRSAYCFHPPRSRSVLVHLVAFSYTRPFQVVSCSRSDT